MSNPNHYTAKDIERYHNGGMTAAEMHQLEKAALDDPMLADALEGYRFSKSPVSEISSLQNRLLQRIQSEEKAHRTVGMQPWLRIAALAILIVGAGWLVLQTFSTRENDLATSGPASNREERGAESIAADSATLVLKQPPEALTADSTTSDIASRNAKRTGSKNPAPQAETSAPLTVMKEAPADKKNLPETKAEAVDAALAPPQNEVASRRTAAPPAVLHQQLDSTVNNPTAKRRQSDVQDKAANTGSRAGRFAADSLGQPETGWAAFEAYIATNRKPALPLNKKQAPEDSVELVFEIDQQGRPVNIAVTQSVNKEYNGEAIRLLKEGPKWKGRTGKVKIIF